MNLALQLTLILVLLSATAGLMRLFFQLGRTAKGLDAFMSTAQKELTRIAEDVHASRVRLDQLADALKPSIDELSAFARTMGRVSHAVDEFQMKFQCGFESASGKFGSLLGLLGPVLTFFKNHRRPHQEERPRR